MNLSNYSKSVVAVVGLVVGLVLHHYGNNDPLLNDLLALLVSAGVYITPNTPKV